MPVDELVDTYGSPCFIYSQATLTHHLEAIRTAFAPLNPLVCFSVKSCSNVHLLRLLVKQGAGLDVVSGGELYRALHVETPRERIVFAGVGKSEREIEEAITAGVGSLNVESAAELERVYTTAERLRLPIDVAVRVNPDVIDSRTHVKTATGNARSKFGIAFDQVVETILAVPPSDYARVTGLHVHIGSPIYSAQPYLAALERVFALITELRRHGREITVLDLGGGFPAIYEKRSEAVALREITGPIVSFVEPFVASGGRITVEPGRSISANAGILATTVEYVKRSGETTSVVLDAGMNVLVRPTLYDAFHFVWPTNYDRFEGHWSNLTGASPLANTPSMVADIVGPICESGDYLALERTIPPIASGDRMVAFSVGAYGMTMASQYNSRPRPPEILVNKREHKRIRARESYDDLIVLENVLPFSTTRANG